MSDKKADSKFNKLMQIISALDGNSYKFRYPTDKDKNSYLQENFRNNIFEIYTTFQETRKMLYVCSSKIDMEIELEEQIDTTF